jgi:hypothetical protein
MFVKRKDANFDHDQPVGLGGKPTFENCRLMCVAHHAEKTRTKDMPIIRKADRQAKAHAGLKRVTAKIANRGFSKAAPKARTPGVKEAQLIALRMREFPK